MKVLESKIWTAAFFFETKQQAIYTHETDSFNTSTRQPYTHHLREMPRTDSFFFKCVQQLGGGATLV